MYRFQHDPKVSYFFSGEFYAYRSLFEEFCPPPMKMEKVMRQLCFDATNQSIGSVFIRLANFLQANWDDKNNCRVLLSQQDLAAAVNCSRTSVARACKIMKEEGVISIEGIGFRILDFSNLETLCRKYSHL